MQTGLVPALLAPTADRALLLVGSFVLLLAGAEVFTNGVEWLGHRLGVSESATGSILAAVGTALPETLIPVIAIVRGGASSAHVGVGAILGAPFMLATVAMFLVGASVFYFRERRTFGDRLHFDETATKRDLSFFLVGYVVAFAAAFVESRPIQYAMAALLVLLYLAYLVRSLRGGELAESEAIDALHLGLLIERVAARLGYDPREHGENPHLVFVALQTLIALALIVAGAHLFVTEVEWLSTHVLDVPIAVVALLIAPLATELPEKFNSVLWISRDKDTLALGNITGAMAFQGTLPVTLGIVFTDWDLSLAWGTTGFLNAFSIVLAVVSGGILYVRARSADGEPMNPRPFLVGGVFYAAFIVVLVYFVVALGVTASGGH
ncbi:sodium/calcium exchanger membrane region [Halarchaeum acidiphilum MH1-52-1]|uniref:Sodium/calcium exchanger membrane region n=2 Tax=Halarchaeum acidiphilum TaxID=489138 RepID=U3AB07_9EURY|nr:sodium/calcium exchanger membrane region [Halarchaeum acidiphilum]GAD51948.1 sodium/calcium exchanger membrane region [Halarchaeum acidiphilum MH1-52-1]